MTNTIYPCLWFDGKAKEAAELYCSVFKNSRITIDVGMVVHFELNGQLFMGLNGGPMHSPNPSISFFVVCETMEEVQDAWDRLLDGGKALMPLDKYEWSEKYGWLQDKFGVSWQLAYGKLQEVGQKFSPMLLFTGQQAGRAEEAIGFYTSIFDDSSVVGILKHAAGGSEVEGTVLHAQFKLGQQVFMAMDSSIPHQFSFTEGVSFVINCKTQKEIDYYWSKLTQGGREDRCGWLKDKFGVSWQVVPAVLGEMMQDKDPQRANRVMQAMLKMNKFDIETLEQAYAVEA